MRLPEVLKNKEYLLLFLGMTVSKIGDWFFIIAIPLLVYDMTGSATKMSIVFALEIIPHIFFSLMGGAFADRINKKFILVYGDLLSTLIVAIIPIIYVFGHLQLWMIYMVVFCLASITSFYHPSFEASVPAVLEYKNLVQGNSLLKTSETVSASIAPVIVGFALGIIGYVAVLWMNAMSFLISGIIISRLKTPLTVSKKKQLNILSSIKEGLRYVKKDAIIFSGTAYMFAVNVGYGAMEALFIFFLKDYIKLSSTQIGIVFATGSVIAMYIANHLQHISRGKVILYAGFVTGIAQIALAFSYSYWLVILCQMVIQSSVTLAVINFYTLRQERVPKVLLGRVVSSTRMVAFLGIPFSGVIAGILVDRIGVVPVFTVSGCIVLTSVIIGMRSKLFT
jgi:MFS family permease